MRYHKQVLSVLTWPCVQAVLFMIGLSIIVSTSSRIFRAMVLPWVASFLQFFEEDPADPFKIVVAGVDIGDYVGACLLVSILVESTLVISLIVLGAVAGTSCKPCYRKLREAFGCLFLFPLCQRSVLNEDSVIAPYAVMGGYYMLLKFGLYNCYIVFSSGALLLRQLLSSLAGEDVLDFIAIPHQAVQVSPQRGQAGTGDQSQTEHVRQDDSPSARTHAEEEAPVSENESQPGHAVQDNLPLAEVHTEEADDLCVCCLEYKAVFAVRVCSHPVACVDCRRRLVYRQLKLSGSPDVPPMRALTTKLLERTVVSCPLCRRADVLLRES